MFKKVRNVYKLGEIVYIHKKNEDDESIKIEPLKITEIRENETEKIYICINKNNSKRYKKRHIELLEKDGILKLLKMEL